MGDPIAGIGPRWLVVMGAAVWPGGEPSPALRRRVEAALEAARGDPVARFLVTGAVGHHPPSEARAMQALLVEAGIEPARIELEETGTDTLSSLVACARIVRAAGATSVTVCSDAFHVPRCRAVLRALGVASRAAPVRGFRHVRRSRRLLVLAHEALATPWDVALALWFRR
jgi:vancomycin permeability regulator SanA